MRAALLISILANLGLAGGLIFICADHRGAAEHTAAPVAAGAVASPERAASVPSSELAGQNKPFRWSQLEDGDYLTYVSNLRSAGCPEATVVDIVRGNAERAFASERRKLGVDGAQPGLWSFEAQTQFVAYALGEKQPAGALDKPPAVQIAGNISPYLCPLVLRDVDLNALGLSEDQKQAVAWIKQEFVESIGGSNQDPSTPAYHARWIRAERMANDELRGWLGTQGMIEYSMAAENSGAQGQ